MDRRNCFLLSFVRGVIRYCRYVWGLYLNLHGTAQETSIDEDALQTIAGTVALSRITLVTLPDACD